MKVAQFHLVQFSSRCEGLGAGGVAKKREKPGECKNLSQWPNKGKETSVASQLVQAEQESI